MVNGGNTLTDRKPGEVKYYGTQADGANPYAYNIARMDAMEDLHYYRMRYETVAESTEGVMAQLDPELTVVRYLVAGDDLYAIVITPTAMELVPLDYPQVVNLLVRLEGADLSKVQFETLHALYAQLWEPLAAKVVTKHVTIIPDRELFNLSFETLLTRHISDPSEFVTQSLLSKHIISYHFSLLLSSKRETGTFEKNYTAFAPGFFDRMKAAYSSRIDETLTFDNAYLTLLSQPFTIDLVKNMRRRFGGEAFLENQATLANFKRFARGAKIIHIGTHAESNNVSPSYSRIIFAKDIRNDRMEDGDNSLYAYELYQHELSSNLTILAACETGKPEYQPGEGMVSMAHAFNYAGSESLLTALWQVDEQSSAILIERFYEYLAKGYRKSEALQRAKLDYLGEAEGRMAFPQYWAGLVIIGDTSPIPMEKSSSFWWWVAGGVLALVFLWLTGRTRAQNASLIDK